MMYADPMMFICADNNYGRKKRNIDTLYTYINEVPPSIICNSCNKVLYQPRRHASCGNNYCFSCIRTLIGKKCLKCNSTIYEKTINTPVHLELELSNLYIQCTECNTKLKKFEFETHKETCKKCPCVNDGSIQEHSSKCEIKTYSCTAADLGCEFQGHNSAMQLHLKLCSLVKSRNIIESLHQKLAKLQEKIVELEAENCALKVKEDYYLLLPDQDHRISTSEQIKENDKITDSCLVPPNKKARVGENNNKTVRNILFSDISILTEGSDSLLFNNLGTPVESCNLSSIDVENNQVTATI